MKKFIRFQLPLILAMVLLVLCAVPASAATTADITVTATPSYIAISCNQAAYDFGVIAVSTTSNTSTAWAAIDNTSSVQTDQTISVTGATWTGGVPWTHSDTATIGADTCGLKAQVGGTWDASAVIVKNAAPNFIAENQAAVTDYNFGLGLMAPTGYSDGVQKSNTVRVSAAAG
jgi:hypothetical protein